jgi:hypothetical protein
VTMLRFRDWPECRVRVELDGVDVTEVCTGFDLAAGKVELHRLRDGQPFVEAGEVALEVRSGSVCLSPWPEVHL